jgi:hypothetical protein
MLAFEGEADWGAPVSAILVASGVDSAGIRSLRSRFRGHTPTVLGQNIAPLL